MITLGKEISASHTSRGPGRLLITLLFFQNPKPEAWNGEQLV